MVLATACAEDGEPPAAARLATGPMTAPPTAVAAVTVKAPSPVTPDPQALLDAGKLRYQEQVRDYTCVFMKQEQLPSGMSRLQEIEVRFREAPHAVHMTWRANADQVRRCLYVDSPSYRDASGNKIARVEPAGVIARTFFPEVTRPIHGDEARKYSRRPIDEFGFKAAFALMDRYNEVAAKRGELDLRYEGAGTIDGRPTHIVVRRLPMSAPPGTYPDAKLIMHLDQEWLLPVALYSYADPDGKKLLGSYAYVDITLNPGLTEQDFNLQ